MNLPGAILPIRQAAEGDCGIAALAMLLSRSYQEVSEAGLKLDRKVHKRGLYIRQLQALAKKLGAKLQRRSISEQRPISDLDALCGIVVFSDHFAVWFYGIIVDPGGGLIWEPEAYYETSGRRPAAILILG